jgi:hypothetical protein
MGVVCRAVSGGLCLAFGGPKIMALLQTAYIARGSVPERESLQAAVDSLGFDCKIDSSYTPFKSTGFLPCVLNGKESGFEIYFEPSTESMEAFPHLSEQVGRRDVAITFRWGGDMMECACILIVSAALAKKFGAIIHYQDDDMLYSPEQLVEEAGVALQHAFKERR